MRTTNRKWFIWLALWALCLPYFVVPSAFSQGDLPDSTNGPFVFPQLAPPEYVVDVSGNRFILGDYTFLLEEVPTPISVGVIDGNVQIDIQTADGPVSLSLGKGVLSLTERAAPYVTVIGDAGEQSALLLDEYGQCPVCGRSLGIGNHRPLRCGHYGCLVSLDHVKVCPSCGNYMCNREDHSRCEHCGVRMCVHVRIECEYMRNPAPTPFQTMVPEEGVKYVVISEDGKRADGALEVSPKTTPWSPGDEFVRTPKPEMPEGEQSSLLPGGQENMTSGSCP